MPEGGCLVTGFQVLLGSAIKEVTSPTGGPILVLKVDTPAHSPRDPDLSSVIHTAPGLTQLHHTALHPAPGQAVCSSELTDLGPDSLPVSHLFSILDESMSLKACLCPTCTLGMMHTWTCRAVLRHRRDKTWNMWESCLRQSVPPTPVYYSSYLPHICPSSDPNPQSLLNVSVSVHGECIPVLTLVGQKKTAPVRRNR